MSKVKDRLNEICQIQNETNSESSSKKKSSKSENKDFKKTFDKTENLIKLITKIEESTAQVEQLITKNEGNGFKTRDVLKEINEKFKESTISANKAAAKLKEFNVEVKKLENKSTAEARIKIIQYNNLNHSLQKALETKNTVMEKVRDIQKFNLKKEISITKGNDDTYENDEELEQLLQSNQPIQLFTDNILTETAEIKRQLADLEERHKELIKIEEQLMEVRDLFYQMALLIDEQQDSLNRVEYHAATATDFIERVDLAAVRRQKKRYLKKKIYLIIILIVILGIIILILLL